MNGDRVYKFLSRRIGGIIPKIASNWIKNPIFVIGAARSGTTLISKLLGMHKDIAHFSEGNDTWDPNGYPWWLSDLKRPPDWVDPYKFNRMWWDDVSNGYYIKFKSVFGWYQKLERKENLLNKSPMNTFKIPYLLELFPDARFVNIYRDGRAETFSYFKKIYHRIVTHEEIYKKTGYYFSKDELLNKLAQFWVLSLQEVENQKNVLNIDDRLYEASYEGFCNNPKYELGKLYDFLNLESSRNGIKITPEIKNMNYKYKKELSKEQIERITGIMAEMLENKGYKL